MEDIWLIVGGLVLLMGQVGCLFAKKVWVRLIPVFIAVALVMLCIIMYVLSGLTNWGYLILLLLVALVLGAMGLVWLVYGIIRLARKVLN